MRLGVQFKPEDPAEFVASVQAAEDAGFDCAYVVDGQLLWRDIYVHMGYALASTRRIMVASAVTNPYTRHYTVTANAHASLAEIYPERVMLGIGRGDNAVRTLGLEPVATATLGEVVPRIRALLAGETVTAEGLELRSEWNRGTAVPILMAGTGPRNLRLAGRLADVVMIQVGVNPISCKWAIDHIRAGAEAAGRNPDEVRVVVHGALSICDREGLAEAHRQSVWEAELISIHVANVAKASKNHGMPEPLLRLAELRRADYDYAHHLDATVGRPEYTDEVIEDCSIIGSPEHVVEQLAALAEVGVDEFAPAYLGGRLAEMRTIGEEVIPKVRSLGRGR
jgi:alkanesulfonate monooxygenase SsuD/methylene tetrahydromethanopterin reductase-like flavin-dependent oxidoreductase (luciferase family)